MTGHLPSVSLEIETLSFRWQYTVDIIWLLFQVLLLLLLLPVDFGATTLTGTRIKRSGWGSPPPDNNNEWEDAHQIENDELEGIVPEPVRKNPFMPIARSQSRSLMAYRYLYQYPNSSGGRTIHTVYVFV